MVADFRLNSNVVRNRNPRPRHGFHFLRAMKLLLAIVLGLLALPAAFADDVPQLGRGINLGNYLEAPSEGAWTNGRTLQDSDFANIKQAGFTFVRVPIRWSAHVTLSGGGGGGDLDDEKMVAARLGIDPKFLARIDWVVAQAEKNGLTVILDYHNDDALMKNPDSGSQRFAATWMNIATHLKDAPSSVVFELLNEPNGKLDAPHWNMLLASTLNVVRTTNPTRTVIVGPVWWNSISKLNDLVLPDSDTHLLVTVHYYDPFHFTHQGASWAGQESKKWLGTKWLGTDAEKKAIADAFDQAAAWGQAHHRPMYLGEFGAYSKGDLDSRARWTACIARTAEARGMAWSYWEYCEGFGAYDPAAKQWRAPLLEALIPK
jgi:endoglucanase